MQCVYEIEMKNQMEGF